MAYDLDGPAELVETIHQPWRATVGECLRRWTRFDARTRAQSYLVLHAAGGTRRTIDPAGIAVLAGAVGMRERSAA